MAADEHRRDPRYPVQVPMVVKLGGRFIDLITEDVSFGGVFAYTDALSADSLTKGQLVQVELLLPPAGASFKATVHLVHAATREHNRRQRPGVGLVFYGMGRQTQAQWDRFIVGLRDNFPAISGRAMRLARARRFEPTRVRDERQDLVLRVEVRTVKDLMRIYNRDVAKGSTFMLATDPDLTVGVHVGLQLIHPNSEDVFELSGNVVRRVEQHGISGVEIQFVDLDEERKQRLYEFIFDGIAELFDEDTIDSSV